MTTMPFHLVADRFPRIAIRGRTTRSNVSIWQNVACPPSALVEHIVSVLEPSGAPVAIGPLRIRPGIARGDDKTEPGRKHEEVRIHWRSPIAGVPGFSGRLRYRIDGVRSRMWLFGTYAVPYGRVGAVVDGIVGRRIARLLVRRVLQRIAARIERRHADWLQNLPHRTMP